MPSQIANDISGAVRFCSDVNINPQLARQRPDFERMLNHLHSRQLLAWPNQLFRSEFHHTLLHIPRFSQRPDFAYLLATCAKQFLLENTLENLPKTLLLLNSLENSLEKYSQWQNSLEKYSQLPDSSTFSSDSFTNSVGAQILLAAQNESNCSPAGKSARSIGPRISRFRALLILIVIHIVIRNARAIYVKRLASSLQYAPGHTYRNVNITKGCKKEGNKESPAPSGFFVTEFGGSGNNDIALNPDIKVGQQDRKWSADIDRS